MGQPYTSKFVLFDEAQLNIPPAASIDALTEGLYSLISDDIAPYDDMDDGLIELEWIASERLNTTLYLNQYSERKNSEQDTDWSSSFFSVLSDCTGLPNSLLDAYMKSASKSEIEDWLQSNLETGASYRQGLSRPHEDILTSLDDVRVLGFLPYGCCYDSRDEDPCDARPEDFGDGRRILVEMKVYWDC
jgi:hypothetical protein